MYMNDGSCIWGCVNIHGLRSHIYGVCQCSWMCYACIYGVCCMSCIYWVGYFTWRLCHNLGGVSMYYYMQYHHQMVLSNRPFSGYLVTRLLDMYCTYASMHMYVHNKNMFSVVWMYCGLHNDIFYTGLNLRPGTLIFIPSINKPPRLLITRMLTLLNLSPQVANILRRL